MEGLCMRDGVGKIERHKQVGKANARSKPGRRSTSHEDMTKQAMEEGKQASNEQVM